MATKIYPDLLSFYRLDSDFSVAALAGGRLRLCRAIQALDCASADSASAPRVEASCAVEVIPHLAALPQRGGSIDVLQHLSPSITFPACYF